MAGSRGNAKRSILREVYEANRDNAGKAPSRRRVPVSRRGGYGMLGTALAALAAGMIWSMQPPSTEATHDSAFRPTFEAGAALVPFALPAGNAPGAADYAMLADQPLVPLAGLFGLGVRTVVIDPGHGGFDPGAVGPNGLTEKAVTLDVARRLKARLEADGRVRVVLTRDGDMARSLRDRVRLANALRADLFISLHLNWLPQEPVTLIETYYFGPPEDARAVAAAARENRYTDYGLADFESMAARLEMTMKHQESYRLAGHIQHSLFSGAQSAGRMVGDAGVKTAPFVVLLGADMPSVLAEITCISNPEEAARLASAEYRDHLSMLLERGVRSYMADNAVPAPMFAAAEG